MKKVRSQKILAALLCTLCCGVACVYLVSLSLDRIGTPALFVNFTRNAESNAIPLHFFNAGKSEIHLDVLGLQYFLFYPVAEDGRYILQLRSQPFGASETENTRRVLAMKKLASKESYEIGDMRSLIAGMPDDKGLAITAVYSALFKKDQRTNVWTGEVRSLPLILTK